METIKFSRYFYVRRVVILLTIVLSLCSLVAFQRNTDGHYTAHRLMSISVAGIPLIGREGIVLDSERITMIPAFGLWALFLLIGLVAWVILPRDGQKEGKGHGWGHPDHREIYLYSFAAAGAVAGGILAWVDPGIEALDCWYKGGQEIYGCVRLNPSWSEIFSKNYDATTTLIAVFILTLLLRGAIVMFSDEVADSYTRSVIRTCIAGWLVGFMAMAGLWAGTHVGVTVLVGTLVSFVLLIIGWKVFRVIFPEPEMAGQN